MRLPTPLDVSSPSKRSPRRCTASSLPLGIHVIAVEPRRVPHRLPHRREPVPSRNRDPRLRRHRRRTAGRRRGTQRAAARKTRCTPWPPSANWSPRPNLRCACSWAATASASSRTSRRPCHGTRSVARACAVHRQLILSRDRSRQNLDVPVGSMHADPLPVGDQPGGIHHTDDGRQAVLPAITAPWVIRPPTSVTRPVIATNRGVQLGSV